MTCRDVENVADLFVDGELEARAMRAVAMHVTRCAACEALVQRLERLQDAIVETFADVVADVDFSRFWPRVAARAGELRRPWAPGFWPSGGVTLGRWLAASIVVALVLGGLAMFERGTPAARPNNQVRIDSLVADADSVALLSEPGSNTTVIWVMPRAGGKSP